MSNKIYVVEWQKFYSEYGFCYMSTDKSKADGVKKDLEERYSEDVIGVDFEVNEYELDKEYEIWH